MSDGTYSDCTIIVTDSDGNASNTLSVTSFTISDDTPSDDDTTENSLNGGVIFGNNIFVAVGGSGNIVRSTDNGSSWDNATSPTGNHLREVTFGNNTFVAVGADGNIMRSTDNGTSFDNVTSPAQYTLFGVISSK